MRNSKLLINFSIIDFYTILILFTLILKIEIEIEILGENRFSRKSKDFTYFQSVCLSIKVSFLFVTYFSSTWKLRDAIKNPITNNLTEKFEILN